MTHKNISKNRYPEKGTPVGPKSVNGFREETARLEKVLPFSVSHPPDSIAFDINCSFMCHHLYELADCLGVSNTELKRWMKERYGAPSMKDLTLAQYKELKKIVRALRKQQTASA